MNFQEQVLDRLVELHKSSGKNPQSILDSSIYRQLPLEAKRSFIERNKTYLEVHPHIGWSTVSGGALSMGAGVALTTLGHQIMQGAGIGGRPLFVPAIATATALGIGVGGGFGYLKAKRNYDRDLATSTSLDDAISTILHRELTKPTPLDKSLGKKETALSSLADTVGKNLTNVAFAQAKA